MFKKRGLFIFFFNEKPHLWTSLEIAHKLSTELDLCCVFAQMVGMCWEDRLTDSKLLLGLPFVYGCYFT